MAKSSRRVQANARTLSGAVRKLFRPVLREIAVPTATMTTTTTAAPLKALLPLPDDYSSIITPEDQLISTQIEPSSIASTSTSTPSAKSIGKRKRIENDDDLDEHDQQTQLDNDRSNTKSQREAPGIIYKHLTQRNVPTALKKYWYQRYRLFSRYDEGIEMDYDGWFSVTPENVAAQIAERCRCKTVVDAFCGVGGNAIQFAMTCERVIAIDNSPVRLACAKANAAIYGVEQFITFIEGDYLTWAEERAALKAAGKSTEEDEIDVVFMSPPWGGIDYQEEQETAELSSTLGTPTASGTDVVTRSAYSSYSLSRLLPRHGKELFDISRKLTKNVAYYLPRNLDIQEAAALADKGEKVEVEEEWMGSKLKALCLYYGDLATIKS